MRKPSNTFGKLFTLVCVALIYVLPSIHSASAQDLNDELRKLFIEIKDDFDPDLKKKIEDALQKDTDRIRFTADEFQRFRSHPINPFDGLDEVDLKSIRGTIELKFEIPTVRNRTIGKHERQSPALLGQLTGVVANCQEFTVDILDNKSELCLGIVIDTRGTVLTKLSEVEKRSNLSVRDYRGVVYNATLGPKDEENDLVLLSTSATTLRPIQFSERQPAMGELLITPSTAGRAIGIGSYSHPPRSLASSERGFLGVIPRNLNQGVEITELTPGGAAEYAGLRVGDIIRKANQKPMTDVSNLVAEVQRRRAGEKMEIEFVRNGSLQSATVTLAGINLSSEKAARFKMMNRLGAIPSTRGSDFPWVFQHDTPLLPEQCGGPILDIEGNVLGINIARQGRVASLAIPTAHLQTIVDQLRQQSIASLK